MRQGVSVHMLCNYVSAIKAKFIMYDLNHRLLEHHKVKYLLKSILINRPLSVPTRNVMDPQTLKNLIKLCQDIHMGFVFKTVFLLAYFVFLGYQI